MLINVLKDLLRLRRAPVEREVLRIAHEYCGALQYNEAIKILTILIEQKPDCVEALILCGAAKRSVGLAREGLADLSRAATLAPNKASCLYEIALAHHALGDNRLALEYCDRARRAD